jgi:type II secretory pathway pseudopilin PulG
MQGPRSDAGFTLIETLVALVIFIACYLLIHQTVSLGWRGVQVAHSEAGAVRIAQGLLAAAGVETPLADSLQSGTTGEGYAWTVQVRRYARSDTDLDSTKPGVAGYRVTAQVTWPEGPLRKARTLQLSTIKLKTGS